MAKKGKQGRPQRKGKAKRKQGRAAGVSGLSVGDPTHGLIHKICSLTDPFCPAARGARFPDGNAQRTIGIQAQQFFTVSTNNMGAAAVCFSPQAPYSYGIGNIAAGAVVGTWPATYTESSQGFAAWINSIARQFRVVSFGVEITPITNAMNSTGLLIVQETNDSTFLGQGFDTTVNTTKTLGDDMESILVPMAQLRPVTWRSRPGGPESRMFNDLQVANEDQSFDWTRCRVYVSGAPASTAVLAVRLVANYEFTLQSGQAATQLAKAPQVQNPTISRLTNIAHQIGGGIYQGPVKQLENYAKRVALDALKTAGGYAIGYAGKYIGGMLGGPVGAAGGALLGKGASHMMIEDVD
jgi:hypothetical protein